ncbi:hypothetical protein COT30_01535 [Candidatus Micrarchaeota archaeon CG08_land_8_20_14_0_20_49_17]|nr:MAG: hypothetical protein COT30_01535 [Candidatus Micrarchaeota archaeon CG08_land_8_20_14_0_20_49_17]PIZ98094.1 MAG: hypothetical protein COX84_02600 [Candidatus Micrarchaeota archaeon CG_4_10_14_0_2_um_filter_49_7]HII53853.1 hypothetical protein [Candidatus Micrarchaeota archaeon]
MDVKKILVSGLAAGVAIFIISAVFGVIVQLIAPYNVLALGGMRAIDEPIMTLFFLYPFVISFAMAIAYEFVKESFQGDYVQKGYTFGLLVWLVAGLTSAFIVLVNMNYPIGFTLDSTLGSLLYTIGAGIVIAKLQN